MKTMKIKSIAMAGVLSLSMLAGMPVMAATATNAATSGPKQSTSGDNLISKTVEAPEGLTFSKAFKFTATQREKETVGGTTANTVNATVTIPDITIGNTTEKKTATANIDLSKITTPGVYTYDIAETEDQDDGDTLNWKYDTAKYVMTVYKTNDSQTITILKGNSAPTSGDDDKKQDKASFTNTVTKDTTFSLKKAVTPNQYVDANQKYSFTVTFGKGTNTKDLTESTITYQIGDSSDKTRVTDNKATIELTDGQTVTFSGIPVGAQVSTSETTQGLNNLSKVEATATSNGTEFTNSVSMTSPSITNMPLGENENSQVYTNTFNSVTVTGVVTNIAPYITMVVAAGAAIAVYVVLKKRLAR